MKFLLDQDVYHITYEFLLRNGFDVVRAREIDLDKSSDREIMEEAIKYSRIIITRDKDFGSLVFFSRLKCPGVILLRQRPDTIKKVHTILFTLLNTYSFDKLKSNFITVESDKYRLRKIP